MTAVAEYIGKHRDTRPAGVWGGMLTVPNQPRHARGTVYVVVSTWQDGRVAGYLVADTGELLAFAEEPSITHLRRILEDRALDRLAELYPLDYELLTVAPDDVPAEVERLRREHMQALGGAR